jgi:hypothetical protein
MTIWTRPSRWDGIDSNDLPEEALHDPCLGGHSVRPIEGNDSEVECEDCGRVFDITEEELEANRGEVMDDDWNRPW